MCTFPAASVAVLLLCCTIVAVALWRVASRIAVRVLNTRLKRRLRVFQVRSAAW